MSENKESKLVAGLFATDEYKYKFLRLRALCKLVLELVGMTNAVVGAVSILLQILI